MDWSKEAIWIPLFWCHVKLWLRSVRQLLSWIRELLTQWIHLLWRRSNFNKRIFISLYRRHAFGFGPNQKLKCVWRIKNEKWINNGCWWEEKYFVRILGCQCCHDRLWFSLSCASDRKCDVFCHWLHHRNRKSPQYFYGDRSFCFSKNIVPCLHEIIRQWVRESRFRVGWC